MANRIFPLLILSIFQLLIDWYIYLALKQLLKRKWPKATSIFSWAWWSYSIGLIALVIISSIFNLFLTLKAIILVAFFITFITKFFFAIFLLADDVRRGILWGARRVLPREVKSEKADTITRSDFIVKAGLIVAAAPFTALSWGIIKGAYDYRVRKQVLYLPNLPKAFDGITLGQLSDIHSGSFYNQRAVLGGVELLLKEKPDFVFFTGDLVNNLASEMRDYQHIFGKVKAPLGVFSVLGNHDYGDYYFGHGDSPAKYRNFAQLKQTHKNLGWDLLLNSNRKLKVGGEEIAIVGVENWGAGNFIKKARLDTALAGTEDAEVKLLMSHDPSHWKKQVINHPDIDVTFSGHTHGSQFGVQTKSFQWSPVQYIYDEWAGLYKHGQQQLYVNVGFGFLGYPGRVGMLPEITVFELKRGSA